MNDLRKRVDKLLKKEGAGYTGTDFDIVDRAKDKIKGSGKKKKGKRRGNPKALVPWQNHHKKVQKKYPNKSFKETLKIASKSWKKKGGSTSNTTPKKKGGSKKVGKQLQKREYGETFDPSDTYGEKDIHKKLNKMAGGLKLKKGMKLDKKDDVKSHLYALKGYIGKLIDALG